MATLGTRSSENCAKMWFSVAVEKAWTLYLGFEIFLT